MIQDHPTNPRLMLVATCDERRAAAIAAFLRGVAEIPAEVITIADTGCWHHVAVRRVHAQRAHLLARAFDMGALEGIDSHYCRARRVQFSCEPSKPLLAHSGAIESL